MKHFTLDDATIAFVVGVIIPLITGVITKKMAPSGLKAIITLGLSAVGGWFAVAQSGISYDWKQVLVGIFFTWGTAIVSYYGFSKPVGITPGIQDATAGFGLGPRAAA